MTLTVSSICYGWKIGISNCALHILRVDEAAAEGQQYVAAATCVNRAMLAMMSPLQSISSVLPILRCIALGRAAPEHSFAHRKNDASVDR